MESTQRVAFISSYGHALKNRQLTVGRESDLPFPKELIRQALAEELVNPTNPEMVNALEVGFLELESFVTDEEFVQDVSTARWMQALLTSYARRFNRVHGRRGHVFEGRYKAIVCKRDSYLLELVRYIHLNPVRAGLVKQPGAWKWSSHGEYLGTAKRRLIDSGPVLGQLRTAARYEAFVREGLKGGYRKEWHPGDSAPFLGAEEFVKRVTRRRKLSVSHRASAVEVLWKEAAKQAGLSPEALRYGGRSARLVAAREGFIRRAVLEEAYRASTVASLLGCDASNISRVLRKG